jgi:hypothetical protein
MKLYNIAESLILETISRDAILDVMRGHRLVSLRYDDEEDPGGKGQRWIEVYCYGQSKAYNDVIRVYQVGGDTKTIQPGWKLFRVDRMMDFQKLGGTFNEPRDKFNPNGDKSMIRIYEITKFD